MHTFSLCMIVKNEERVLARCLDSLQGIFDQIVIVDTGSTDSTVEIAKKYTDEIYHFQWVQDFSAARNFAFSKCNCDYIYSADADEVLDEKNRLELINLKMNLLPEIEIVQFLYVNTEQYATTENQKKELRPKLYKRLRTFTWIDPIHESVNLHPVVFDSDIEIVHMPESIHSKRDFSVFENAWQKGEYLSDKLLSMYARELWIAGEKEDYDKARDFFYENLFNERRGQELHTICYIILARAARLEDNTADFFKWTLKNIATEAASEICFEIGAYYENIGDLEEAILWYINASSETKPVIDLCCPKNALIKISECYTKMAENSEELRQNFLEIAVEYKEKADSMLVY